ncbi:hypothetical protein SLEP1_g34620 [Rubroshorea leprosula]|uniref:Uncharacterized protein n=1 Tax=Rubroshorea leprosula TaxID=152421 RepID=A0AAV5KKK0_9ROSI|nr:hypothetical protein SLEP1_g34620 [Rubroshorea leprosula]
MVSFQGSNSRICYFVMESLIYVFPLFDFLPFRVQSCAMLSCHPFLPFPHHSSLLITKQF